MASDDLRGQVARRLSSLDGANAPAYPKEMQQLKLVHTSGVLSRILLDYLEEAYEVSARQLAVNDAGACTGGFVDDPAAAVTTLDCDDLRPSPEHRTGYYSYDTLHYQIACTRDAIPTLRRLVDLIGALETTFLQRYAPGQDLAKWNKKQDALLRRVGAAGAAPAGAAEAFVAGIDDSELQRELHLPRLAAASRGPAAGEAPAQPALGPAAMLVRAPGSADAHDVEASGARPAISQGSLRAPVRGHAPGSLLAAAADAPRCCAHAAAPTRTMSKRPQRAQSCCFAATMRRPRRTRGYCQACASQPAAGAALLLHARSGTDGHHVEACMTRANVLQGGLHAPQQRSQQPPPATARSPGTRSQHRAARGCRAARKRPTTAHSRALPSSASAGAGCVRVSPPACVQPINGSLGVRGHAAVHTRTQCNG